MNSISIWVIYDHPLDFPHHFIARRWELDTPTNDIIKSDSLEELRKQFSDQHLFCLQREPGDDPAIVETWLTGKPSTLGSYLEHCMVFFGDDSSATAFIRRKIASSPNGENEEVTADERMFFYMLAHLHIGTFDNDRGE